MNSIGGISSYTSITAGESALSGAKMSSEKGKFEELVRSISNSSGTGSNLSSSQVVQEGHLNGDYKTGFAGSFNSTSDKNALPVGAAANQANPHVQQRTIDKTSKLYEKSLEMESYIVKMMISSMRKTVIKAQDSGYAQKMYEDMLFDEYTTAMTKNAGFGLADQMYLQLSAEA